jgi:hypothetical protein
MNKFSSYLVDVLMPLVLVFLAACTGAQLGLNAVKPVNPTAPFSTMGLSFDSKGQVDDVVKQLIRSYQRYGALYSAAEKEAPTLENTCYEITEKIAKVQPLASEHEAELVGIEKLYKQLTTLRENDPRINYAAEAGEAYIAKARERIRKFDDLLKITSSFSADCPRGADWVAHVLTGVSGLAQYMSAKEKVPTYNQTGRQLEELSAEERGLAVRVVQSLEALTGQEGSTSSPAGREG